MRRDRRLRLRFGLKTLFVLMLGIAIGYSLNVWSLWLAIGPPKYYVITKHPSLGDNFTESPITGNETVLDAIARIGGISPTSSTEIWIARRALNVFGAERKLPVDWDKISSGASSITNYQVLPGDRLYISQKPILAASE